MQDVRREGVALNQQENTHFSMEREMRIMKIIRSKETRKTGVVSGRK
jgi:hypothetical protein